jgi:hypothetical protein
MRGLRGFAAGGITLLLLFGTSVHPFGQLPREIGSLRRATGQPVAPVFEGWEPNPDGTFTLYFGYFSMNWQEEVDIPVGPNNFFDPGPQDRGQPAHFHVNRHKRILGIRVPKDFGTRTLTWTLIRGTSPPQRATGSLANMYTIEALRTALRDARGESVTPTAGAMPDPYRSDARVAPIVDAGPDQSIVLPQQATLTVVVKDPGTAGVGRGRGRQGGAGRGKPSASAVRVQWRLWRGPGKVSIREITPPMSNDGRASTTVSFSEPGVYMLQVIADDGSSGQQPQGNPGGSLCCWSDDKVTIEVKTAPGR